MTVFFMPAVLLMNQLKYPKKFLLIGTIVFAAIAILLYSLYNQLNRVITLTHYESDGIEIVVPLLRLVQQAQQHRGLSSGVINGNAELREKRASKQEDVERALQAVDQKISSHIKEGKAWQSALDRWEKIKQEGLSWPAAKNFETHTNMISDIFYVEFQIADATTLILDSQYDSHYLIDTLLFKMSELLETLGQIRATGTGILAKKEILEAQKIKVGVMLAMIEKLKKALNENTHQTALYNPTIKDSLLKGSMEFTRSIDHLVHLIQEDILGGKFTTDSKAYFKLTTEVIDLGYRQLYDLMVPTLKVIFKQRLEQAESYLYLNLVVALSVILVVAYLAIGTYLSVILSIKKLSSGAHQIAGGDLCHRVTLETHDELSEISSDFNEMSGSFLNITQNIQENAEKLALASRYVNESAGRLSTSAKDQHGAALHIVDSIHAMIQNLAQIEQNVQHTHQVSNHARGLSENGMQVVKDVVEKIHAISQAVNYASSTVHELGKYSQHISEIVDVIKQVAEQTNLLALNAAIEAARAGDSGRGFAVVANEIRSLASRTTKSTKEITQLVSGIQNNIQKAIKGMQTGVQEVDEGVILVTRTGQEMTEIQKGTLEILRLIGDISRALAVQTTSNQEIENKVDLIADTSERSTADAVGNAAIAEGLFKLSDELQSSISHLKIH